MHYPKKTENRKSYCSYLFSESPAENPVDEPENTLLSI